MKLKPYKLDINPFWETPNLIDWLLPQMSGNNLTGDTVRFNNTAEQFTVELDLPGVLKENINLEVFGQRVFVTAKRNVTSNGGIKEETINRSFTLDNDADLETITAKQDNGVLTLLVKRKTSTKHSTKRINVS